MIRYGGIDLGQYMEVRNISYPLLPTRENYTVDIPSMVGKVYNGFKYGERVIEVDFLIRPLNPYEYVEYVNDIK